MLAATDAAADAALFPHQLRQQAFIIAGKGDVVPVAAVIGEHRFFFRQLAGKGQRGKFLAHTGVDRAVEFAFGEQLQELILNRPDQNGFFDQVMVQGRNIFADHLIFHLRLFVTSPRS